VLNSEYGSQVTADAMNRVAKLSARWLGTRGFSIGIDDVTPGARLANEKAKVVRPRRARYCPSRHPRHLETCPFKYDKVRRSVTSKAKQSKAWTNDRLGSKPFRACDCSMLCFALLCFALLCFALLCFALLVTL